MAKQNGQKPHENPINKGFVGNVKNFVAKDSTKKAMAGIGFTTEHPIPALKLLYKQLYKIIFTHTLLQIAFISN